MKRAYKLPWAWVCIWNYLISGLYPPWGRHFLLCADLPQRLRERISIYLLEGIVRVTITWLWLVKLPVGHHIRDKQVRKRNYLFEGIVLVDNVCAAGRKVIVPELGEHTRARLHVNGEALVKYIYSLILHVQEVVTHFT